MFVCLDLENYKCENKQLECTYASIIIDVNIYQMMIRKFNIRQIDTTRRNRVKSAFGELISKWETVLKDKGIAL